MTRSEDDKRYGVLVVGMKQTLPKCINRLRKIKLKIKIPKTNCLILFSTLSLLWRCIASLTLLPRQT